MTVTIAKYQRSNRHSIQQLRPVRRACWLFVAFSSHPPGKQHLELVDRLFA
jgi:hypothetical protein